MLLHLEIAKDLQSSHSLVPLFLIPYLNLAFVIYLKTLRKLSKQHSSRWEGVLCVSKKVVQLTGRGMPGKAIPGITDVILLGTHFKYVDKKQSAFLE